MDILNKFLSHAHYRYIDHTNLDHFHNAPFTALSSFAIDDTLAISVSRDVSPPVIRTWMHDDTVVLGIPDARLPYLEDGVKWLAHNGFNVIVRNSGGLAVALDKGVLNVSLVLPGVRDLSIHDGYEAMYHFIQSMFKDLTDQIEAYEIIGSYCPGDYDLSIHGIKFAGISQRRVRNGVAIQIYLDIIGNSHHRAEMIRQFYKLSLRGEKTRFTYPSVQPEKMGSLSTLLGQKLTIHQVKERLLKTLSQICPNITTQPFSKQELATYEKRYDQMIKRNEEIAHILK